LSEYIKRSALSCNFSILAIFASEQKCQVRKVQAIAIGKQANSLNLTFDLGGTVLECEKEVKLLGVTIDFM
jgi:hypothetical protein